MHLILPSTLQTTDLPCDHPYLALYDTQIDPLGQITMRILPGFSSKSVVGAILVLLSVGVPVVESNQGGSKGLRGKGIDHLEHVSMSTSYPIRYPVNIPMRVIDPPVPILLSQKLTASHDLCLPKQGITMTHMQAMSSVT